MTINKLASMLAKREGKKSQARIGDIRELLKLLATMIAEEDVDLDSRCNIRDCIDDYAYKQLLKLRKKPKRAK